MEYYEDKRYKSITFEEFKEKLSPSDNIEIKYQISDSNKYFILGNNENSNPKYKVAKLSDFIKDKSLDKYSDYEMFYYPGSTPGKRIEYIIDVNINNNKGIVTYAPSHKDKYEIARIKDVDLKD